MPVTINPRPLLLQLNRRPWNKYDTDQYAGPYTIEFTPGTDNFGGTEQSRAHGRLSNSLKIEFNQSGPIDFMDGNREFALTEDFYTINGAGNFLFTVRVNAGLLNNQNLAKVDYTSLIKTTERTQLVKWHELTSHPGEAVEPGMPPNIEFPIEGAALLNPYYVEARVYLRSVERGADGLWYGTEVWPGGWAVGWDSQEDENKARDHRIIYDFRQATDRDHLLIKFKRNVPAAGYANWNQSIIVNEGQVNDLSGNVFDNLDPTFENPINATEEMVMKQAIEESMKMQNI